MRKGERMFVKRWMSMILVFFLLVSCLITGVPQASASSKANETRTIGIVFDNSGSMYDSGDQAWCRATYAMEVFASMMNKGDRLFIYPMSPITVGGRVYTMDDPFQITDASQAVQIREILTEDAGGTPIESIDCAAESLQAMKVENKYLIVLTDGGTFSKNDSGMSKERTKRELDSRFQTYAGEDMTVMYLGIGTDACVPAMEQSEFFVNKQARNSAAVLSALTEMCNLVFGRDSMPRNHISADTVDFDISMSKMIAFVQGENIADLKVTDASGAPVGQLTSSQQTMYSTVGAGDYTCAVDASLQGMMVTYADCDPGTYNISYTGTATSVEIYYEPDADLDFVFTDANGNTVDPNALYDGDYKVSFGIKDGKTGQMIDSDLLGDPQYLGYYSINGEQVPITHNGYSGEVPVTLNMNDAFDARLTVTYLSGYTITKDASDFGWPEGGIQVASRPAGELRLEITGGDSSYSLQDLRDGTPYTAKVYYEGQQLTGEALESVDLRWDPDTSNAEIKKDFADDHWNLHLDYKDPAAPQDTACGPCTVTIYAYYAAKGTSVAEAESPLSYEIRDDYSPFQMEITAPEDYIVISKLESSKAIVAGLTLNGAKLNPEDFAATSLEVDTCGIEYTLTPDEKNSAYQIKLLPTEGIAEGEYPVHIIARYADHIGRETETEDTVDITLSNVPLWLRWTISLVLIVLLIAAILVILHLKVLPKYAHLNKKDCSMIFDGEDESKSTTFFAKIEKGQMVIHSKYAGTKTGLAMDVKPGKESYLRKAQARKSAEVKGNTVRKYGNATILEANIGSIKYLLNEDTNKLERMPKSDKPFLLKHGMPISYTGTMLNAGVPKPFTVNAKLNFKKK